MCCWKGVASVQLGVGCKSAWLDVAELEGSAAFQEDLSAKRHMEHDVI